MDSLNNLLLSLYVVCYRSVIEDRTCCYIIYCFILYLLNIFTILLYKFTLAMASVSIILYVHLFVSYYRVQLCINRYNLKQFAIQMCKCQIHKYDNLTALSNYGSNLIHLDALHAQILLKQTPLQI